MICKNIKEMLKRRIVEGTEAGASSFICKKGI
jgi:hypothetical protein